MLCSTIKTVKIWLGQIEATKTRELMHYSEKTKGYFFMHGHNLMTTNTTSLYSLWNFLDYMYMYEGSLFSS